MALLEVNNLTVGFKDISGEKYNVIKNISFSLNKGQVLGIVGESGSGKSLTALSILGLLPYPKAFHGENSSIKFSGAELLNNQKIQEIRGKKIGFVFQEPLSSLNPLHTIGHQIAETLKLHQNMTSTTARRETIRLLKLTGIKNAEQRYKAYPFELSGGQRQRVMIAMAIANNPDILIADEPTTALDVTIAAQIINLLKELKNKLNMAIIFISHDLNIVRQIADNVVVMKGGKIIEQGSVAQIFNNPVEEYTKTLVSSSNILKKKNNIKNSFILEAKNIVVRYPLKRNFWGKVSEYLYAVNRLSFKLKKGKTLGVVGESGCGKTTLAFALVGLTAYDGNILVEGTDIKDMPKKELSKKIQIVFQDPFSSLNPRMTAAEIIGEGIKVHFKNMGASEREAKVRRILQEVGLRKDCANKYPHEFSGGQRQRIAIARALAVEPEILILDEPTTALDVTIGAQIIKLLQKIQKERQLSYFFISHDMRAIRSLADDIAVMKNGKFIELNNAELIFRHPQKDYTKYLLEASDIRRKADEQPTDKKFD